MSKITPVPAKAPRVVRPKAKKSEKPVSFRVGPYHFKINKGKVVIDYYQAEVCGPASSARWQVKKGADSKSASITTDRGCGGPPYGSFYLPNRVTATEEAKDAPGRVNWIEYDAISLTKELIKDGYRNGNWMTKPTAQEKANLQKALSKLESVTDSGQQKLAKKEAK